MVNVIGNIFEGIIEIKIEKQIEENDGFEEHQYGFTKTKKYYRCN